ncbi:hypothetical protein Hdeb2414_s0009g00327631 [Helianthus debilis subsp. tardiflorus]
MYKNNRDASSRGCIAAKLKEETKKLEHFLEETFQLLRYIVTIGQKMMEINPRLLLVLLVLKMMLV